MGHVRATLTITNRADQVLAERGLMRPEEVRTVTLDNVLVDTGVTLLGLPADVISRYSTSTTSSGRTQRAPLTLASSGSAMGGPSAATSSSRSMSAWEQSFVN